mgnify:CR=1 FL=1
MAGCVQQIQRYRMTLQATEELEKVIQDLICWNFNHCSPHLYFCSCWSDRVVIDFEVLIITNVLIGVCC